MAISTAHWPIQLIQALGSVLLKGISSSILRTSSANMSAGYLLIARVYFAPLALIPSTPWQDLHCRSYWVLPLALLPTIPELELLELLLELLVRPLELLLELLVRPLELLEELLDELLDELLEELLLPVAV